MRTALKNLNVSEFFLILKYFGNEVIPIIMIKKISAALLFVLILGIVAGYSFSIVFPVSEKAPPNQEQPLQIQQDISIPAAAESSATVFVPAVDEKGKGIAIPLNVRIMNGSDETLIDINNLVFWLDTQQSIQIAKSVAQNITEKNLERVSLIYAIRANASVVEGPSAGAALAIATIAALENKTANNSVMITGTINPDGTIGQVGGILEKAKAAKQAGAKLFLLPKGQGSETLLKPTETCAERDSLAYCTTRYKQVVSSVSEKAGINVKEVATIAEAEKYFFG